MQAPLTPRLPPIPYPDGMAYDLTPAERDAAALETRRKALRGFVEDIAAHVRHQDLPETYLDADRAVRAIAVADKFLERMPPEKPAAPSVSPADAGEETMSPVRDPHRLALRAYADRVMAAAVAIDKPDGPLEAWRAVRYARSADRMLLQLYSPPKSSDDDFYDGDNGDDSEYGGMDAFDAWRILKERRLLLAAQGLPRAVPVPGGMAEEDPAWWAQLNLTLSGMDRKQAATCGQWPDGTAFDPDQTGYWDDTPPDTLRANALANEARGITSPMLEALRQWQAAQAEPT